MNYQTHNYAQSIKDFIEKGQNFDSIKDEDAFREYLTLRLDFGRQTGKSNAVVQSVYDMLYNERSVILVLHNGSAVIEFKERLSRFIQYMNPIKKINMNNLYCFTSRSYMSLSKDRFRGIRLTDPVVIIEEPMSFNSVSYYNSFKHWRVSCAHGKLPYWIVVGVQ